VPLTGTSVTALPPRRRFFWADILGHRRLLRLQPEPSIWMGSALRGQSTSSLQSGQ
jgi:hypothetical protein